MAKPPKDEATAVEVVDPGEETQEEKLLRVLSEADGGNRTLAIERYDEFNQRRYLGSMPASVAEADLMGYLLATFGGGKYYLQARRDGAFIKGGQATVHIEGTPRTPPPPPDPQDTARLELERTQRLEEAKGMGTTELLARTLEELAEIRRDMSRLPPAAAAAGNPMDMGISLVQAIQTAQAPLLERILDKETGSGGGLLDSIETLTALMTLAQGMSGNQHPMSPLVSQLSGPLANLLNAHAAGGAQPAAAPNPNQPPPPPTMPVDAPRWLKILGPFVPTLQGWARHNKNPELRAHFAVDELPDEYLEPIYEELHRSGFEEEFFAQVPAAAQYRAWYIAFFEGVRQDIIHEEEPTETEGSPPADTPPAVELS